MAQKCPKHVERITGAIKHSVTSSWFFFPTQRNNARTNTHQGRIMSGGVWRGGGKHDMQTLQLLMQSKWLCILFFQITITNEDNLEIQIQNHSHTPGK